MISDVKKTPFPWFGGKREAAPHVWQALGDVNHYVEPFCGGLAVLLNRPHMANRTYYSETVNDFDGLLVNAWRSIQLFPRETAEAASWPVSEADLHARHLAILRWKNERELEHLMGDTAFCDPKIGGWWLWGQSSWIGSGWCSGTGGWVAGEGGRIRQRVKGAFGGVSRQIPFLGSDGGGVNQPQLREPGVGNTEFHALTMPELLRWFDYLSARLRHVRIVNGDWTRVVTKSVVLPLRLDHTCGVFLDPPYADTAGRKAVYSHEDMTVAHAVKHWALEHGKKERYRIVMAGYDAEHGTDFIEAGWREVEWYKGGFMKGGMGNVGKDGHQQHRERLFVSPACLDSRQGELFQTEIFGGEATT